MVVFLPGSRRGIMIWVVEVFYTPGRETCEEGFTMALSEIERVIHFPLPTEGEGEGEGGFD
jgi:hypothetical protein